MTYEEDLARITLALLEASQDLRSAVERLIEQPIDDIPQGGAGEEGTTDKGGTGGRGGTGGSPSGTGGKGGRGGYPSGDGGPGGKGGPPSGDGGSGGEGENGSKGEKGPPRKNDNTS